MNKFLRVLFILVILAMTGAIIFQLFFFLSYLQYHHSVNAVGAFENYLLVLGWVVGWWLEVSRIKKK